MPTSYRVITHIHSTGSNDLASAMYPLISSIAREQLGPGAERLPWFECLTTVADLEAILDGRRTRGPVDLLFLTDHMSARRHVVADEAIDLACRCPRFAVGGEVQTAVPDGTGGWLHAPEILLYGTATPQSRHGRAYFGVTQAQLDELFDRCTRPGAPAPDPLEAHAFCVSRGIACALAHPLDGHDLGLPHLLGLVGRFDFVETLNGGYSDDSARLLERLLDALRRPGDGAASNADAEDDGGVWRGGAGLALGGSDAHLDDFDRVVTTFRHDGPRPDAGDFVRAMLAARRNPTAVRGVFGVEGHGMSARTLYREVFTLIFSNAKKLRPRCGAWGLLRLLGRGAFVANAELRGLARASRRLRGELLAWLEADGRGAAAAPWSLPSQLKPRSLR